MLGVFEIPAYTATGPIIQKIGRKPFIMMCFTAIMMLYAGMTWMTWRGIDNCMLYSYIAQYCSFVLCFHQI